MSEKIVEISEDSLMWIDERYNRLREENKRLHSIITEVREYIENNDIMKVEKEEKLREELELVRCDLHNAYSILDGRNEEIERLNNIIKEQDKELELERKSRQLLTDDLAKVCEISLKKDNIIKEVREYIESDYIVEEVGVGISYITIDKEKLLEILDKVDKENK